MGKPEAVFIDRDGTIGGTGHFIHPRDFTPYSFSREAFRKLRDEKINTFAFTNQHRISRGEASLTDFYDEFMSYGFDDAYICPHGASEGCDCRKPKPGLLLQAAQRHNLDLRNCVVIGDVGSTDMLAAHAVGATKILVLTGWGENSWTDYRQTWADTEPEYVAKNLLAAVDWVLGRFKHSF